jgi:hypothetical protein
VREPPPLRIVAVRVCDSRAHGLRLATKKLWWIDGPVEYCEGCCDMMLHIAEVLGMHPKTEDIPVPEDMQPGAGRRAMLLDDGKKV